MNSDITALISDADGTLVDTVELIQRGQYQTAKRYLARIGVPERQLPTYETYLPWLNRSVGRGARHTLEHTMRLLYAKEPELLQRIDFDDLYKGLDVVQDEIAHQMVKPYPGLDSFLMSLGKRQIKLAIFTSGTKHHIVRNFGIAVPRLGQTELFRDQSKTVDEKLAILIQSLQQTYVIPQLVTVTIEDVTEHKPSPEGVIAAMKRLGVTANECAMLGDQDVDMMAANAAGVDHRIGVTHGFGSADALQAGGATQCIDSLVKLEQ